MSAIWNGKKVVVVAASETESAPFVNHLVSSGAQVVLTWATIDQVAKPQLTQANGLWKSPFDIHSYDTLSRIFQHAKIQFGNIDIVVAFLPSGLPDIPAPLVINDTAKAAPLSKLFMWICKIAKFQFRWDDRPETLRHHTLIAITPTPATRESKMDRLTAASVNTITGTIRSLAPQSTFEEIRLMHIVAQESLQDVDPKERAEFLTKGTDRALQAIKNESFDIATNGSVFVIGQDGSADRVGRPDWVINNAKGFSVIYARVVWMLTKTVKIQKLKTRIELLSEQHNISPTTLMTYVGGAILALWLLLFYNGWVGVPKILFLVLGFVAYKQLAGEGMRSAAKQGRAAVTRRSTKTQLTLSKA